MFGSRKVAECFKNIPCKYYSVLADYRVNGMVVDYGAGWGYLVNAMIEQGFDARGVEISQDQVAYAQQRGLPIQ